MYGNDCCCSKARRNHGGPKACSIWYSSHGPITNKTNGHFFSRHSGASTTSQSTDCDKQSYDHVRASKINPNKRYANFQHQHTRAHTHVTVFGLIPAAFISRMSSKAGPCWPAFAHAETATE